MHSFDLTAGALCLDFVNTVEDRPACRQEHLVEFEDLLAWAGQAGLVGEGDAEALRRRAGGSPAAARRALRHAIRFRESLYRLFSGLAAGRDPASQELETLNRALGRALSHLRIQVAGRDEFLWRWGGRADQPERLLWPVARSAAELLTSPEATRIKECAADRCSWLFVDRSRSRRRRWCDMKSCGNREKARRHYRRRKAAGKR